MSNRYFNGLASDAPEDDKQDDADQLPEELKGKSTAEVYELLKQEHNRVLEDETKSLKSQLYEYQQKTSQDGQKTQQQQPRQQAQQPQQPQYQYGYGYAEQQPDIFSDPEGFLDRQLQQRVAPMAQMTFDNMKEINKQQFRSRIGEEEWSKYGGEISQFVDALAPEMQANPRSFETAYNLVRSQHLDEIVSERSTKESDERTRRTLLALGYDEEQVEAAIAAANGDAVPSQGQSHSQPRSLFQSDTGTVPTSQAPPRTAPSKRGKGPKLTREQREAAAKFGMSEEEYAEYYGLNTDMYSTMVEGFGNG